MHRGVPGAGFDARPSGATAAATLRVEHAKRKLQRLDDDDDYFGTDDTTDATVPARPSNSASEVDPLDAFMSSLNVPPSKRAQPPPAPTQTADEIDPLDAFMATLEKSTPNPAAAAIPSSSHLSSRSDLSLDDDDPVEGYIAATEAASAKHQTQLEARALATGVSVESLMKEERDRAKREGDGDGVEAIYDEDTPLTTTRKNDQTLQPVDHATMKYRTFRKQFYTESPDLAAMTQPDMDGLMKDLSVTISAPNGQPMQNARICFEWKWFGFDAKLLHAINKQGFEDPTPIQSAAIPLILSGHDLIGLAKTGSGKTGAFVWSAIVHIMDQEPLPRGASGPIALILAPTRELADQIYREAWKYTKVFDLRIIPCFGGMQKYEQVRSLKQGCDVVVGTPGRIVDLLVDRAFTCEYVTFLVLDEADRMLSLGFEQSLRNIFDQIRPDRQVVLFSATMEQRMERIARKYLRQPVTVKIGEQGALNTNVQQEFIIVEKQEDKLSWLLANLQNFLAAGPLLIFTGTRLQCEDLAKRIALAKLLPSNQLGTLHGDHHQGTRMEVLQKFKAGAVKVLVATDVAARGLDIKGLPTVVCYDPARSNDAHVHRVGRTGRAGASGRAVSLLLQNEDNAANLVDLLEQVGQQPPPHLLALGLKNKGWARARGHQTSAGSGSGMLNGSQPHHQLPPPPPAGFVPAAKQPAFQHTYAPPPPPPPVAAPTIPAVHPSRMGLVPGAAPAGYAPPQASVPPSSYRTVGPPKSYNAVPPPSYNAVPPPASLSGGGSGFSGGSTSASAPISLAATIAAAHARAAAMAAATKGGATPSTSATPPPSVSSTTAPSWQQPASALAPSPAGIHPSRLGLVPGTTHTSNYAPPPPPPPPSSTGSYYPSPNQFVPPPSSASPAATFVHPSRSGMVPTAVAPPPPPPAFHPTEDTSQYEPPRKKSRWE